MHSRVDASSVDVTSVAIVVSCRCPDMLAESLRCFVGVSVAALGVVMHPEL